MGELIDFAERQKSRRKKKASSMALLQIVGGDKLIIPFC